MHLCQPNASTSLINLAAPAARRGLRHRLLPCRLAGGAPAGVQGAGRSAGGGEGASAAAAAAAGQLQLVSQCVISFVFGCSASCNKTSAKRLLLLRGPVPSWCSALLRRRCGGTLFQGTRRPRPNSFPLAAMEGLIRQAAVPLLQQQARGFASRAAGGAHVAVLPCFV